MSKRGNFFVKFWNFLWNDESIWGWLVSLIVIFVFIKFIFFPGLSFVLSSSLPLVVVESSSMSHQAFVFGEFNHFWSLNHVWYEDRNISKFMAKSWPLKSGLEKGDIALVVGYRNSDPVIGDIIVFNAGQQHPIIHRVVDIQSVSGKKFFFTKGDGNPDQLSLDKMISRENIIGKAIIKIPKLGWIKLLFVGIF
ncbi:MAG: signal peptidase I [Nanoarchaeota archaeon]